MVSIVGWFNRHRAKAIALSQLGFSIGGLSVPLVVFHAADLRLADHRLHLRRHAVIVIGLPLVQLIRHRPEDHGELPDGEPPAARRGGQPSKAQSSLVARQTRDFTAREAMRTHSFWLISLGHALALLTVSAVMVHLIAHLTESLDYTVAEAGGVVALLTGFMMLGQLSGGYLGDRFNKRFICAVCMVAHAAGLLLVTFAGNFPQPVLLVLAFTVLHGLAWGTRGPLMVALRADYFGPSSFGTIMGFSSLIVMLGMSGGPVFAGRDGRPLRQLRGGPRRAGRPVAAWILLLPRCHAAEAQNARGSWQASESGSWRRPRGVDPPIALIVVSSACGRHEGEEAAMAIDPGAPRSGRGALRAGAGRPAAPTRR